MPELELRPARPAQFDAIVGLLSAAELTTLPSDGPPISHSSVSTWIRIGSCSGLVLTD